MATAEPFQPSASFVTHCRQIVSRGYYKVQSVMPALKAFREYIQGASSTLSASPVCLLGHLYQNPPGENGVEHQTLDQEVLNEIVSDFTSRLWLTYREGFPPIGDTEVTTDTGWGCTLRTGQMLLAQALLHHTLGRHWRRQLQDGCPPELVPILAWFSDSPSEQDAPFSIHNMCAVGQRHGVTVGRWLGPSTLCKTLEELVNKVQPGGLHVHVVASPDGGVPVLCRPKVLALFDASQGHHQEVGEPVTSGAHGSGKSTGLLLLVPLRLGLGKDVLVADGAKSLIMKVVFALQLHLYKVLRRKPRDYVDQMNPCYIPQLQEVLTWPQSAGIVGGRPSSSLYFIGVQDQNVLYLDPHEVQQAVTDQSGMSTYFCSQLRLMALSNIDPSLALGFYCDSADSFTALSDSLADLEKRSPRAPLLCVTDSMDEPAWRERADVSSLDGSEADGERLKSSGGLAEDDWEMLG